MNSTDTIRITVPGNHLMPGLLGRNDELLKNVETAYPETLVHVRGNEITIEGNQAATVARLFNEMITMLEKGMPIDQRNLSASISMVDENQSPSEVLGHDVLLTGKGKRIRPKSAGQKRYVEAIAKNVITFGIGPAGTGKSWLAVAMAVQALKAKEVDRIILTRPAVEAGERLGFLPGDLMAKIDPYLRPLYDALYDMVDFDGVARLQETGSLEIAPLAFMRGRTLNNSFIILDEAQNTTPEQMKMFLTRIGFGSKAVVTGDATQIDVPDGRSGLHRLNTILGGIEGLEFVELTSSDVVRHSIVQRIVNAYASAAEENERGQGRRTS